MEFIVAVKLNLESSNGSNHLPNREDAEQVVRSAIQTLFDNGYDSDEFGFDFNVAGSIKL